MNKGLIERLVNSVLYEGYILYPYRPSVKNRQRWTFGGLFPRSYSEATSGSDAWALQTECLVQGDEHTLLQINVRFLHLQARRVGELEKPVSELPEGLEPDMHFVDSLRIGDKLLQTWQEATERDYDLVKINLLSLTINPANAYFSFPARRWLEQVRGVKGEIVAMLVREQAAIVGGIEISAHAMGEGLFKLKVRVENLTALEDAGLRTREEAELRGLLSTHVVLGARHGAFISLTDPPAQWREIAGACQNIGAWPVLIGEPGARDKVLAAPIILYDYPQIAPESPGDLFDGTEIDEILTLRILTLTDDEKQAAAALDERTRALLQRTEALDADHMLGLHGTTRRLQKTPGENVHV
jgi:hydrogenase maturation protease